jgi:hypothetical protein
MMRYMDKIVTAYPEPCFVTRILADLVRDRAKILSQSFLVLTAWANVRLCPANMIVSPLTSINDRDKD